MLPILCKRANIHSTEVPGAATRYRKTPSTKKTDSKCSPWNPCSLSTTIPLPGSPPKRRVLSFAINDHLGGDSLPEQVACPSSGEPGGALQGTDPHPCLGPRCARGLFRVPAIWLCSLKLTHPRTMCVI